jgi:RHS repeat-associated protein
MGFSTQKFSPKHTPKAALSPQLWHEKTASRKFFDRTKIASKKSPAKPTTTREKSDRTYETATEVIYEHYRYTAFGEPEIYDSSGIKLATSAIKNEILWNSRRYDSATNLYYYKYRHYKAGYGSWTSRDPIEENGGVNLYGFCKSAPFDFWDMFGLMEGEAGCSCHHKNKTCPENIECMGKILVELQLRNEKDFTPDYAMKAINKVKHPNPRYDTYLDSWNGHNAQFDEKLNSLKNCVASITWQFNRGMCTCPTFPTAEFEKIIEDLKKIVRERYDIVRKDHLDPVPVPDEKPIPVPVGIPEPVHVPKVDAEDVAKGAAAVTIGYLIYRGVRLIPSCTPATCWTLPANLVTP